MKPKNNTENLLKTYCQVQRSTVSTDSELDRRVLNDARMRQEQSQTQSAGKRPQIWRVIMQSRMIQWAAAAVIILGVMVGIYALNGEVEISGTALASELAVVQDNMQKEEWIHSESESSEGETYQEWIQLKTSFKAVKGWKGTRDIYNYQEQKQYHFDPLKNVIEVFPVEGFKMPIEGFEWPIESFEMPIESFEWPIEGFEWPIESFRGPVDYVESIIEWVETAGLEISYKKGTDDRKDVGIYMIETEIKLSGRYEYVKAVLKVDIESKLLVKSESEFKDLEGGVVLTVTVSHSYPDTGPASIYDLGVSQTVKIVDHTKK